MRMQKYIYRIYNQHVTKSSMQMLFRQKHYYDHNLQLIRHIPRIFFFSENEYYNIIKEINIIIEIMTKYLAIVVNHFFNRLRSVSFNPFSFFVNHFSLSFLFLVPSIIMGILTSHFSVYGIKRLFFIYTFQKRKKNGSLVIVKFTNFDKE